MNQNNRKSSRVNSLQTFELVPITDPAQQAAIEERIRQAREAVAVILPRKNLETPEPSVVTQISDLFKKLAPEEKVALFTQLFHELPPDRQLTMVKQFWIQPA